MTYKVIFTTGETREFGNIKDLCKGLSISKFTVYGIINGTCMFKEQHTKPLKGVKIISSNFTEEEMNDRIKKADNLIKERESNKIKEEMEFYRKKLEECEKSLASL
jgi:hypothetical protein